jgi:Cu+-exporting ATPase
LILIEDTTLSRIIQLVENAQASRAPIQQYADKISSIFVPIVLVIALFTWVIWVALFTTSALSTTGLPSGKSVMQFATEHAIAVLVIACPCALGLATPTAVMVGSGIAASFGILIKGGGAALEKTHSVNIVVFDKTGTLTVVYCLTQVGQPFCCRF